MIGDPAAGFRLRKRNIGIGGPERVDELFGDGAQSDTRFNQYFIGEIHVLHNHVIPNARRDGFEELEPWITIRKQLTEFARERKKEVRKASEIRNKATQLLVQESNKFIRKIDEEINRGVGSTAERDDLITKVRKRQENLEEAKQAKRSETEIQQIDEILGQLREKEQDLAKTEIFTLKRIKTHLDRKLRLHCRQRQKRDHPV